MSDDLDEDSKTEEATPRKKEQLREKGEVVKSPDVTGAATVVAVFGLMMLRGDTIAMDVRHFAERSLELRNVHAPVEALRECGTLLFSTALPIAMAAATAAVAASVIQTKGLFNLTQLAPKPERLDPVEGIKKVLPGKQMLIETGKSLLKVSVVTGLAYWIIADALPLFTALPTVGIERGAAEVGYIAAKLAVCGVIALALLAAVDYFIAWRKFEKKNRMAKHEVEREHKDMEGDPRLKGKRRQKARELAQSRSVKEVGTATVIVTNPTHISVALRYDPERGDPAPIVVAQGVDAVAMLIRTEARKHGIPIVENKPLARAIHGTTKVGQTIPLELYEVAARVIAHVMGIGRPAARA